MDVRSLFAALSDTHKSVRIATLRTLLRLPLDAESKQKLRPYPAEYERRDLGWATWVPDSGTVDEINELLKTSDEEEHAAAKRLLRGARSPIAREFARLALEEDEPQSHNILGGAEEIAISAANLEPGFPSDIGELFEAYRLFLRRAASFWFTWVQTQNHTYNPWRELPSWFPLTEGALAACRQIEWIVSRASTEAIVDALSPICGNGSSADRFAAAQLIEWAERTRKNDGPWRFGGGSGPSDTYLDFESVQGAEYKAFNPEDLPTARAPAAALPSGFAPPSTATEKLPPSTERKINFWITEEGALQVGTQYTGNFQVGLPVLKSLMQGEQANIPDSDVPVEGLATSWTVIPSDATLVPFSSLLSMDLDGSVSFELLIPHSGESAPISLGIIPKSRDASLLVLILIGARLYRKCKFSLGVTAETVSDTPFVRAVDANLRTTHEWTTPPGTLTILVNEPGWANLVGSSGPNLVPRKKMAMGTAKSKLKPLVKNLRDALEVFRAKWTPYLNDIDAAELDTALKAFQPQYDWGTFHYSADSGHESSWVNAAMSPELHDVAYHARFLYTALFPAGSDLRLILEGLPPSHVIEIVWTEDSGADWIPELPWALLYMTDSDPALPVDGSQFWGHRFRINYTTYSVANERAAALGNPAKSYCANAFFYGVSTNEPATLATDAQRTYWSSVGAKSLNVIVPPSAGGKVDVLQVLTKPEALINKPAGPVAVLYFFCHYGATTGSPILRFGLTSNPTDTIRMPELGTAALTSRPLVFANACATAGSDVDSANAITQQFFTRGCSAFIGTETMVPAIMASRAAIIFFHFFLRQADPAGKPISAGEALVQTRLFLWCHYRNMGGLFYSYLNNDRLFMADEEEIAALR